jgi:hypothetical protein
VFHSFAAYLFKTPGDIKGIYPQVPVAFQSGMRGTREKPKRLPMHVTVLQEDCSCYAIVGLSYLRQLFFTKFDLKVHGFERISLPTEWLIIGDRTKAADFTKLWNDLHKSISFVKGAESQSWMGHFWTHCR